MIPRAHQLSGAKFLADKPVAILADEPRVGKTGAAIIAADYVMAETILVVTTASGRAVWRRGFAEWSAFRRDVQIATPKDTITAPVCIVGWPSVSDAKMLSQLLHRRWDVIILDESHYAKSFEAKRTKAVYGEPIYGHGTSKVSIASRGRYVWCLTGTPLPNSPADIYPFMRALTPERLTSDHGPVDVSIYADFLMRYCHVKPKKIGNGAYARWIDVITGGRKEKLPELRDRLNGFWLRRTQADVGIGEPIYETLPLLITKKIRREIDAAGDAAKILAAAESGSTKDLEMHLGPLRRLTGEIKARAVVEAMKEEFECGLDKVVLMAWHRDTLAILREGLAQYGVVGIDGSTSSAERERAEMRFRDDPSIRVAVNQIVAAGEAVDFSAAAELVFVESSFVPKDMKQAALRITNIGQKRQARVRVAMLEGSLDEALETILTRKWTSIKEVLK